jgi:hypothetical protein
LEGQPFSEFSKARGPVGGAFPDIIEPKRPTLSRTRRGEEETVDEAAKVVLSLLTLVVHLLKSNQPHFPFLSPFLPSLRSSSYAQADLLILSLISSTTSVVEHRHVNVTLDSG